MSGKSSIYVVCVNMPGCLPEMEPYAVEGTLAAWRCACNELEDSDSLGYSFAEFVSALDAGGTTSYLDSGYVVEVTPLDALGLDEEDRAAYVEQATA